MRTRLSAQLLFLGVVWGAAFLFIRVAVPDTGPLLLAELRVALAASLVLGVAGRSAVAAVAAQPRAFVLVGLLFAATPFTLLARAGAILPAPIGALLNASVPLFTVAGVALLGRQPPRGRTAAGALLGLVGVGAIVGVSGLPADPATGLAVAMALGAAASYAAGGIAARRYLAPVDPRSLAAGQLTTAAILLAIPAAVSLPDHLPGAGPVLAVLGLAVVSTALAWPVYFGALASAGPVRASVVTFVTPVFAILFGAAALGEALPASAVPGAVALGAGIALVLGIPRRRPRSSNPPVVAAAAGVS